MIGILLLFVFAPSCFAVEGFQNHAAVCPLHTLHEQLPFPEANEAIIAYNH